MSALGAVLGMHTVSVETLTGATPTGDGYAAPVTVRGFLDDGLVVERSPGGQQLVSKTVLYTDLANDDLLTVGSRVVVNDRTMHVAQTRRRSGGGLLAAVEHLEVDLS